MSRKLFLANIKLYWMDRSEQFFYLSYLFARQAIFVAHNKASLLFFRDLVKHGAECLMLIFLN